MIFRLGCLDSVYKVCLDDHALSGSRIFANFTFSDFPHFPPFKAYIGSYTLHLGLFWKQTFVLFLILFLLSFKIFSTLMTPGVVVQFYSACHTARNHTLRFLSTTHVWLKYLFELWLIWNICDNTVRYGMIRYEIWFGQGLNWYFGCQNDSKTTISNRDIVPSLKF